VGGAPERGRLLRRERSSRMARMVASRERRTGVTERRRADVRGRRAALRARDVERGDVSSQGTLFPRETG